MKKRQIIIGVMGPGAQATARDRRVAFRLGQLFAVQGWFVLSGGVNKGVMDAVSRGAKSEGGLTIGIIPRRTTHVSKSVSIPIITDIGSARNVINALSSDLIVAVGGSLGTMTEIGFALQADRHVILMNNHNDVVRFWRMFRRPLVHVASTPEQCARLVKKVLRVR